WLDVARFAESHGFEQDYDRPHAYHYRDFVIKAFNRDLPFDQFVQWQIAGDELKPQEPLAMMATGFLGAGVFPTQLTEKEFEPARYDELDDMASTIGTAMLGITIGCARCHDHKFDPIPQRDYYQFLSTFSTTIRSEVELELNPAETRKELGRWQQENEQLVKQLKSYENQTLGPKFEDWLKDRPETKPLKPTWVILDFDQATSVGGATFKKLSDGSLLASGKNPEFDQYQFVAQTNLKGITAIRVEALAHDSLVRNGPGRAVNGNFALGTLTVTVNPVGQSEQKTPVRLSRPRATFQQNTANLSVASSIDANPKTGWAVDPQFGKNHTAIFEFQSPTDFDEATEISIDMRFDVNHKHSIGRPRISITNATMPVGFDGDSQQQKIVEIFEILKQTQGTPDPQQREALFRWYRTSDNGWQKLHQQIQAHLTKQPRPKKTRVMVSSEGLKPLKHHADGRKFPHFYPQTYYLKRGDPSQKQGVARQAFLQVFTKAADISAWKVNPPLQTRLSYRRATLANWITDTQQGAGHQLARVIVNRIWQQHLGRGIVATPNDFGFQGARPTHPELLDWLAQKLIDQNWSLKSIHRAILTSSTYRQSSFFDRARSEKDPGNQFFWRYSPRRLEAEIIRDSMLSVSKNLDPRMYGPGTLDEKMKRRSIYFMIKRSRLIPMMQIFDSPEPLTSAGSRPSTTIAPQALLFMNNPNVRQYASDFAKKLLSSAHSEVSASHLKQVVKMGFKMAIAREPTADESGKNLRFIQRQLLSYETEKKKNALEMAVTDFCQVLFCLNEFIYVD
ncbi:MAG: DUF1549 and DUF1553 domain-containing protein, partial [Planctomycetota bacterium]|nr:DUF1549 and DUF1553 domain-containing protein [Planctomycetota bacterium]